VKLLAATCAALFAAACGQKARPDVVPAGSAETACAGFGFGALQVFPLGGLLPAETVALLDSAQQHHSKAQEQSKPGGYAAAAREYLACGLDFAKVPEGQARAMGQANAAVCFDDAMSSFAMAGTLGAEGKAALEKAAAEHATLAEKITARLAKIKDCPVKS
jgi:hypothetical protein